MADRAAKVPSKRASGEVAAEKGLARKPEPSAAEVVQIAKARHRIESRPHPVTVTGRMKDDNTLEVGPPHDDGAGWYARLQQAFGSSSGDFTARSLEEVARLLRPSEATQTETDFNHGLAVLDGLKPENEIEGMLGIQMVATHNVAMSMLTKAKHTKYLDQVPLYGNLAVKLLRTYTAQAEALAKLRRKGEQTVRVEHVHVHSGGQAIVGHVSHAGGGGSGETGLQPHEPGSVALDAQALALTPGAPVWGSEPGGESVPVAGNEGQEAVPAARRRSR